MKKALVLHGYRGNPYVNWYPWLGWKLRRAGYKTWVPRLPMALMPNGKTWNQKLLSRSDWDFKDSVIVGHSAGAVEILNLLSILPKDQKIRTAVLVSAFRPKPQWPALKKLIDEPLDFAKIKSNCESFIFVIASDDPLVPVADAEYYCNKVGGQLIVLPAGGHFSILRNPKFWRFPELFKVLQDNNLV